jgi:hypothetical protein
MFDTTQHAKSGILAGPFLPFIILFTAVVMATASIDEAQVSHIHDTGEVALGSDTMIVTDRRRGAQTPP